MSPLHKQNTISELLSKMAGMLGDFAKNNHKAQVKEDQIIATLEQEIEQHKLLSTYKKIESLDDSHTRSS